MPHCLRRSASVFALMALTACAGAKPVDTVTNPTPAIPAESVPAVMAETGPGNGFAGTWYVSGVFPTAMSHASIADPHLGTAVTIEAAEVSDVNGQRCVNPDFKADLVDAAATGLKAASAGNWERLVVNCGGKPFATYIRMPDQPGSNAALLQQRSEGLYLLEQAGTLLHRLPGEKVAQVVVLPASALAQDAGHDMAPPAKKDAKTETHSAAAPVELTPTPEPSTAPTAAPAPVPEGPVAVAKVEPAAKTSAAGPFGVPAKGTAIHLASYKGESAAKRGWKVLLGEYDELDPLSPLYVTVDVPGKGAIIRLYANGVGETELAKICSALKAKKAYCALNP